MAFTKFSHQSTKSSTKMSSAVILVICLAFCCTQASPTNKVQSVQSDDEAILTLGKLLISSSQHRPISQPTTIWDLLVEKAEGYMHSMLYCTLSRPDVSFIPWKSDGLIIFNAKLLLFVLWLTFLGSVAWWRLRNQTLWTKSLVTGHCGKSHNINERTNCQARETGWGTWQNDPGLQFFGTIWVTDMRAGEL